MYKIRLHVLRCMTYFLFVLLLAACTSNVISIDSKDSATFTMLETSIPLSKQRNDQIKLRVSRVSGDYNQAVPDGKLILIEDNQIWGPTDINGTTDLTYVSISYGTDELFLGDDILEGKLRSSVHLGLAQTDMDLTLVHQDTTYRISDKSAEFYMQAGLSYAITPSFHGGASYALSIGPDLTGISEFDLKIDFALFKHLQIVGGYRWFEYNYLVEEDDSNIRVEFRGPFVGLNIPF